MSNQRFFGLTCVALCLMSPVASAQRVTDIENGVRVRITESHGHKFVGSLVASTPDSVVVLAVQADGTSGVRSTASTNVARIEVSSGRNRAQGALIKGAIGLGIGAVTGAVLGAVSYTKPEPKQCTPNPYDSFGFGCLFTNACFFACSEKEAAGIGAVLGGASGLVIGAIVGAVTGHESWTAVQFR